MKKISYIICFIISLVVINNVSAEVITVNLKTCIDGDTAIFKYKNENIKARFLAIDTPETEYSSKGEQPYGKEASEYTCNKLKKAKKIELEYDSNSDKTDKYDRHLVWVWTDGNLLQKDLVNKGYAKVTYLYNDYKNIKIWSVNKEEDSNSNTQSNSELSSNNEINSIIFDDDSNVNILLIILVIIFILIISLINYSKAKKKI